MRLEYGWSQCRRRQPNGCRSYQIPRPYAFSSSGTAVAIIQADMEVDMTNSRFDNVLSRNRRHAIKDALAVTAMVLGSFFLIVPLF